MGEPALRLTTHGPAPIAWEDWVPIDQAARALGVHRDSLGRRCRQKLAADGFAMRAKPPAGGVEQWFVHRAYHPAKLAHGRLEQFAADQPDLGAYTERQREIAWARWDIVVRFREAKRTRPGAVHHWMPSFVEEMKAIVAAPLAERGLKLRISARSVQRWHQACETIADIEKLIDKRGGDTRSQGDAAFWDAFAQLYLTQDNRDARPCWKRAKQWAEENGHDACSYKSLLRQLDSRIPPAVQLAHRDPKAYRDTTEPTAQLHPETFATGERLEGDQRTCDVRVVMPDGRIGRPTLTAWIDWRTRRVMGHVVEAYGDSTTISAAMYRAISDPANIAGPPRIAWVDNGKDYLSTAGDDAKRGKKIEDADQPRFRGLYAHLGIDLHLALPKGPRGKGRIERFFQTKGRQLDAFLVGYCGPAPEHRPESLAELEKQPAKLMTLAEYREHVARWIDAYNADADHRKADLVDEQGRPISPDAAFAAWCPARRRLQNPEALKYLLMKWHKPRPVTKNGVRIEVDGQSFYYGASNTTLIPFRNVRGRRKRYVIPAFDPEDTASIYVFDEQLRFVCIAGLNHGGGLYGTEANRQQMKQIARDRRKFNRAAKQYYEGMMGSLLTNEERLILESGKHRKNRDAAPAAQTGTDDRPIQPVQTPLDDQMKALQTAETRRNAGASPIPFTSLSEEWGSAFPSPEPPADDADDDGDGFSDMLSGMKIEPTSAALRGKAARPRQRRRPQPSLQDLGPGKGGEL